MKIPKKNVRYLGKMSNNRINDLFGANVHKALESCW